MFQGATSPILSGRHGSSIARTTSNDRIGLYFRPLLAADPLHLILGARYTNCTIRYNPAGSPDTRLESTKDDVTPCTGLVYDINEDWSTYVSYTNLPASGQA